MISSSGAGPELPAYDVDPEVSIGAPSVPVSAAGVYHAGVPDFAPSLLSSTGGRAEDTGRDITGVSSVCLVFAFCLVRLSHRANHTFA